jgi:hypothetical protein
MKPSKAGQSCSVVIRDASSDWKQDILLSAVRNQSWRGLRTETAKLRKTRTMEVVDEAAEEAVVEGVVVDADVAEEGEVVVILLDLLVRVKLRLPDNEKKLVDPIAGMEELERWLELVSLVRCWKSVVVRAAQ